MNKPNELSIAPATAAARYAGPERRAASFLTEDDIERIAQRAAEVALEKVYASVGKSVVNKFLWLAGSAALAVAAWLNGAGHWK